MSYQNLLDDSSVCAVADASILININSSNFSEEILSVFGGRMLVPALVRDELEDGLAFGRTAADALRSWTKMNFVRIVELGPVGMSHFNNLVAGPSIDTLDDGESATIACALESGNLALIDEKKANRICQSQFPNLRIGSSMDIFRHEMVQKNLGAKKLADAVFNALDIGHMRILSQHNEWTVDCIGPERASKCTSLPASIRRKR